MKKKSRLFGSIVFTATVVSFLTVTNAANSADDREAIRPFN